MSDSIPRIVGIRAIPLQEGPYDRQDAQDQNEGQTAGCDALQSHGTSPGVMSGRAQRRRSGSCSR